MKRIRQNSSRRAMRLAFSSHTDKQLQGLALSNGTWIALRKLIEQTPCGDKPHTEQLALLYFVSLINDSTR